MSFEFEVVITDDVLALFHDVTGKDMEAEYRADYFDLGRYVCREEDNVVTRLLWAACESQAAEAGLGRDEFRLLLRIEVNRMWGNGALLDALAVRYPDADRFPEKHRCTTLRLFKQDELARMMRSKGEPDSEPC